MFTGEIFGPDLLVVAVVIAVVVFGGSAIPKLARSLGQAKSEFKAGLDTVSDAPRAARRAVSALSVDTTVPEES
ncbi:MAG: twin-arginine translocase TatA/TatE family subunit [Acidobacteriota bacterium]|nr:twin-arginine translocase TatA/TatE family subunit [Acidobacteriota bacterium]